MIWLLLLSSIVINQTQRRCISLLMLLFLWCFSMRGKIILLNPRWGYYDVSISKWYHWICVEGMILDRFQNNTSRIYVFIWWHTNTNGLRAVYLLVSVNRKRRYDIGSIPKQYHPNMCFSSMTCAYKWMIYEVPYQIDSVLILRISFIYNFLWITHRSFELLTDHLPCYSHNYIGNTQRRNKYND
jgi:hypothetical protein